MMSENIINGTENDEEIQFEVDSEVKKEFLKDFKSSTRTFYSYVLKQADSYEKEIGKSLFDFNIEDREELLIIKFKNKSSLSFQANLSPIKRYVDFCISRHLVRSNENRFSSILPSDYENYVNVQAQENSYIPKSEIRELEELLTNEQDKLIIELLSWGVRGRTEKGNTLEELINLKVSDVNFEDKTLYLTNNDGELRPLDVDDFTLNLIKKTIDKSFYFFNNGFKGTKNEHGEYDKTEKGFQINQTEYVFRVPGKNKFKQADHQLFANRIQRIQTWVERPYLTISAMWFSSMIDYAKSLKEAKGEELDKKDYIRINERFQFGGTDGEKYLFRTKELLSMYI